MLFRFAVFCILLLTCGCAREPLTLYTHYISEVDLASYHVETPDPRLLCPDVGQQLLVSWNLTEEYLNYDDLHIELTIRFRNREEIVEDLHLNCRIGTYVYYLLNEDFFEKNGILTYKADLIGGGWILSEWRHQLWAETIVFPENSQDRPDGAL